MFQKNLFQAKSSDQTSHLKNGNSKASNGLGLSSSESEDDSTGSSRRVFPRLNCGITSNSPIRDSNKDDDDVQSNISPVKPAKSKGKSGEINFVFCLSVYF